MMNFDRRDLVEVIQFVSNYTGRNFILPERVSGKITILSNRSIPPDEVWNVFVAALDAPLREGTVITIEPILGLGSGDVRAGGDGWTILTADGAPSAHAEHTLVVSGGEPLVLTAAG
jgi:methionine aminopeptidase